MDMSTTKKDELNLSKCCKYKMTRMNYDIKNTDKKI